MIESLGHPVKMFLGAFQNIKVTAAEDLIIVEEFLKSASSYI
jgi:2-C-methyl-D-erythritol 4-phosphate cytidylyltransferase